MDGVGGALFAVGAIVLFFFLPGYLLVKALWPEKRWRGPQGAITAVEMLTGGFVASLGIFLIVGFVLGNTGQFYASPSSPTLEGILAVLAVIFLALGWIQGAYRKDPPPAPSFVEPPLPGEEDLEPMLGRFQEWAREERRLQREVHRARREGAPSADRARLEEQLQELRAVRRKAERTREEELSG